MRTVVVSAVNLRKGGTLTILRQCLEYLSGVRESEDIKVVALVHDRSLCECPGIEYIEMPWCIRSWEHRLWAEYVTMHRISREIAARDGHKVWLWLSLHDTTPRVEAEHQEVYCHTSFPFLKLRLRDWLMDPKIPLFALFTKWAYRINVRRNDSIIVQQNWFADALSQLVRVPRSRFRVIPPSRVPTPTEQGTEDSALSRSYRFLYASTPDCHKNFELLCEASRRLEAKGADFRLTITVRGDENRYARWLKKRWGDVKSIDFHGLMPKEELFAAYAEADCFVFPSRIETWGLPISEYIATNPGGKLLLADLPYAHETAEGADAGFFGTDDIETLTRMMYENIAVR